MAAAAPLRKQRTPVLEPSGSQKLVKVPERELDPEVLMKDPEFVKKYEAVRLRSALVALPLSVTEATHRRAAACVGARCTIRLILIPRNAPCNIAVVCAASALPQLARPQTLSELARTDCRWRRGMVSTGPSSRTRV